MKSAGFDGCMHEYSMDPGGPSRINPGMSRANPGQAGKGKQ